MPSRAGTRVLPIAVVTLVALTYAAVVVQHTAGAYVRGESLWAKGQKGAVIALARYAASRRPSDLAEARAALQVPLADHRARTTLESADPDYAAAARHFVAGGNAAADARNMARLFPVFRRVPAARRAVEAWTAADVLVDSLGLAAVDLERAVAARDEEGVAALLDRVYALDRRLTVLEDAFSTALADASRVLPPLVLVLGSVTGLALIVTGQAIARRLGAATAAAHRAEQERLVSLRDSERSMREVEARLARAQKMEAVGQLAGGIAHEFNNLLTAVVGNLELAREDVPADGTVRADLDEALAVVRRATGLTRQLLTFGRQQILDTRRLDVNALVADVESMVRRLVGDRIHLHADLDPQPPFVMADAGQLQQVLLNLVVNARDAMPDGGVLTIATGRERPPDAAEGRWVHLEVRDTGTGMDEATRARALEPFFTTKPHGQGSGLGLAVVDGIVAQARGRLQVESATGAGTAVRVFLPESAEDAAEAPLPAVEARPELRGASERILLVEDEHAVRETTRRMLERAGYEVLEAKSAEDALILWARPEVASRVDLLVTDVMLPGIDGLQLLARLREGAPRLRALVVSGYTGHAAGLLPEADGARTATLRKPFGRDELLARVRALLELGG